MAAALFTPVLSGFTKQNSAMAICRLFMPHVQGIAAAVMPSAPLHRAVLITVPCALSVVSQNLGGGVST
jgi:hypothetical protein